MLRKVESMNLTSIVTIGNFVLAIPPGIAAIFQLANLSKKAKAPPMAVRLFLSGLLLVGTACAVGLGVWSYSHPPQPEVVTKIVEKPVPCPPSKTGPATTHGTQSPAISGTQNGVNYGQPNPQQSTSPKKE